MAISIGGSWRRATKTVCYRAAAALGYDVVRRNYYSPIPNVRDLPADVFSQPKNMYGVDIDTVAMLGALETTWAEAINEIPEGLGGGMFGAVDAEVLYATIRTEKPGRVLELGSGQSTRVTAAAIERNRAEGHETVFVSSDPYVDVSAVPGVQAERWKADEVPEEMFAALGAGDVLFVDTTHTVKVDSDVNYLILDVLPRLNVGVHVHFHDIFLPYEYPRFMLEDNRAFWAEQYLLQAFLAFNPEWVVTFAAYATMQAHTARVAKVIESYTTECAPGSFWLRKVA